MRYAPTAILFILCILSRAIGGPVIESGDRVLVLGDEFAVELGTRGVLESIFGPGVDYQHRAESGAEAARLPRPVLFDGPAPDVVVVCVGMVDAIRGDAHLPRFRRSLASFAEEWSGSRLIMITPVPPEPSDAIRSGSHALSVAGFVDAIHVEAGRSGCRSVDLHGPLTVAARAGNVPVTHDGLHLTDAAWRYVEREIAWQLGHAELDPPMALAESDGESQVRNDRSIELDWLEHPERMPALDEVVSIEVSESSEPSGPTWDEAVATVQRADAVGTESLREALARLAAESDRTESARDIMLPLTDASRSESVRLAALAALDDLPESVGPVPGIRTIAMEAVPVKMVYDVDRFEVLAGEPVRIVLENPDAQPHNLLILKPGSLRSIGRAVDAMENDAESKSRHWVPESPKVLHVMSMVQPGERGELRFVAPERPGRYPFVCTYPGHWRMMNGVMTVRRND